MTVLWFVVAAAVGTALRAVFTGFDTEFNHRMIATGLINVVGSFLLGWVVGSDISGQLLIGVAGLGSFTTFSTMVSQIECIAREGRTRDAVVYATSSLTLGVAAAWLGLQLT